MNSAKLEFDTQISHPSADGLDTEDAVQALWGCECALPFLIPAIQAAVSGNTLSC
ncbi:MAG: hypothetical protein RBS46_02975 [Methyloversatilis sp.]|jgi:hypothetical protein|nr:hypothetical protein [Methyloversatilis sp.]